MAEEFIFAASKKYEVLNTKKYRLYYRYSYRYEHIYTYIGELIKTNRAIKEFGFTNIDHQDDCGRTYC